MSESIELLLDLSASPDDPEVVNQIIANIHSRLENAVASAIVLTPAAMDSNQVCSYADWDISSSANSIGGANEAFQRACFSSHHLLVLLGSVTPDSETLGVLAQGFKLDPYFGIAIARQFHPTTGAALKLSCDWGDRSLFDLPPEVTLEIPDYWLLPDVVCSCFIVRDFLLRNFDFLDETYTSLSGALYDYVGRVRRCGFRCIVVNKAKALASAESLSCQVPPPKNDMLRLYTEYPDNARARTELALHACHTYESLLARTFSRTLTVRQSLLIDARGLPCQMNGTAQAVLSVCSGLANTSHQWTIAVLAERGASEFHGLKQRYPNWNIIEEVKERYFTAAIRLSQPWDMQSILDLHRMALFNFYTILDTIAWDILAAAPRGLGAAWAFVSAHADGIVYISEFTRERFTARFPLASGTPGYVSQLSFLPGDYATLSEHTGGASGDEYIFVVGNSFVHKDVRSTVDLLSGAFPFQFFKALGLKSHASPRVEAFESGYLSQGQMDILFAEARIVVFPSFYEGFGFPILKALSLGRTVVARHSSLLLEVAGHYRGPGRLIAFRDRMDLVAAIGAILHAEDVKEVSLGFALDHNSEPKGWREISHGVLDFVEGQMRENKRSRWLARQGIIEQMSALKPD